MAREFGHIPEAWPALLDRPQLCAYVGLSDQTLARILPVHPVDLGVRGIRWKRLEIDQWIISLPPRLPYGQDSSQASDSATADGEHAAAEQRRNEALERVKARAREKTNRGKNPARPARQEA
jgi:predicted DNA-binding transcriptional regulator AlpA